MALSINTSDAIYRQRVTTALIDHYFANRVAPGYLETDEGKTNLNDHISGRYELASKCVIPWLRRVVDLPRSSLIEVGSGTGSSTLALAEVAKSVDCYEIHQGSIEVARERLAFWGVGNVNFHGTAFSEDCDLAKAGRQADAIVLYAVLEHMTHQECLEVLALSWRVLLSGGALVVAETPNRFSMVDEHTSWLPFFSQLPREIQVLYASRSPRQEFRWAIDRSKESSAADALESMTRWGSGISYHEFELAIGSNIHDLIVLDGYEEEMIRLCTPNAIDVFLQSIFAEFKIQAHRAFTRRHLYFVARKP